MGNFQELRVWQNAKTLAVNIYKVTQSPVFAKDFGLKDQIQRSAVSIPSNIAEGDELETNKQSVKHFFIAKGSSAELRTQIIIAHEIGYLSQMEADKLTDECRKISIMLSKLIHSRSMK